MIRFLMKGACAVLASLLLAALPSPASALDPNHSGSWYDPSKSGHGFSLEIFSDTRAIMFWYTYDNAGEPLYLYADGTISGNSINFTGYYFAGMQFGTFDPAANVRQTWGTMSMTFLDCDTATFTYASTLTGTAHAPTGSGTIDLKRLVGIKDSPCRRPVAGYWTGRHYDPTLNNGAGAWSDLSGVLTTDGRVFFSSDASEEVMLGTYTETAGQVQFDIEVCEEQVGCYTAEGAGDFEQRDWIVATSTSTEYGTQPVQLSYRTVFERDSNVAMLAGNWVLDDPESVANIQVSDTGAVTGTEASGCVFAGQLSRVDSESNFYNYVGTVTGCTNDNWNGVAVLVDSEVPGSEDVLEFRLASNADGLFFRLNRAP